MPLPPAEPRCRACRLPVSRCPAAFAYDAALPPAFDGPAFCSSCDRAFRVGHVFDEGVDQHEATQPETWCAPGWHPVHDSYGYRLTWSRVLLSHQTLVRHATCEPCEPEGVDSGGYGSDDGDADVAPCPCAMGGMDDELFDCRAACQSWPGPVCGMCFASSCACGYVFDDAALAAARDPRGRLICHACVAWSGLG